MDQQLNTLNQIRSKAIDLGMQFGPRLLVALLILFAGVLVSRWVARAMHRALGRLELEPPVRMLLVRVVRVLVLGLFLIMALQNLGVELLPLIAGIGVAGAGVALATQGVLSNVVAGLTIIFTKPYRVGEYIQIVGVEGQVHAITLFSTTLLHADRSHIVVPNRKIVGEILHNYGRIRQVEVHVGISYESDLKRTLTLIGELVRANPRVLADPAPVIQIVALADSSVQIAVKPWVAMTDFIPIPGELNLAIVEACRREGISIPFPHHVVQMLRGPA